MLSHKANKEPLFFSEKCICNSNVHIKSIDFKKSMDVRLEVLWFCHSLQLHSKMCRFHSLLLRVSVTRTSLSLPPPRSHCLLTHLHGPASDWIDVIAHSHTETVVRLAAWGGPSSCSSELTTVTTKSYLWKSLLGCSLQCLWLCRNLIHPSANWQLAIA